MSQMKPSLIILLVFIIKFTLTSQTAFNGTSCYDELDEFFIKGFDRGGRGINFISDNNKFVKAKREPRLFSFNTDDQDVNVKMEFGVPFITIPTKRTFDGLKSVVHDAMQGKVPKPHFNIRSLALIGCLCLGFSTIGVLMENFNFNKYVAGKAPHFWFNRSLRDDTPNDIDEDDDTIDIWQMLENLDKTLSKYNIDTTACVQHSICNRVQESLSRVVRGEQEASHLDIILEGITRSDWIMRYISGTAIEDAIRIGRTGRNCDAVFASCTVNLKFFSSGIQEMLKNVV